MVRLLTSRIGLSSSLLHEATELIRTGGLLAIPTESSYALCVSPFHAAAVDRVCALKGGRDQKPILVLIGDRLQLKDLVEVIPPPAELLMDRYWPGPLTMVLPAHASLPGRLTAGTGTIGVRLSAFEPLVPVLGAVGPLTGTSANRSGEPPLMTAEAVVRTFGDDIDAVLDLGAAGGNPASTVIAVQNQSVSLVREGPISRAHLRICLAASGFTLV
ncbi:hypothetical protein YTPLAS18_22620 [Nitrospira sp.]|nr:hypothetical protein YTPLAS18_22620 [Nitrospira sp.]